MVLSSTCIISRSEAKNPFDYSQLTTAAAHHLIVQQHQCPLASEKTDGWWWWGGHRVDYLVHFRDALLLFIFLLYNKINKAHGSGDPSRYTKEENLYAPLVILLPNRK